MASPNQFLSTAPSGSDVHWLVAATTTASLILSASSDGRSHASIFNDAVGSLYLYYGGSNSGSVIGPNGMYDVKLTSGSYYELPRQPVFQGQVWGAWDLAGGWARVVQFGVPK
jgi:hypothetical protein